MKCMIVEDNFTARQLLQTLLRKHGTCHIATNGTEAVNSFQQALEQNEPYDMLCLDIHMPQMTGHDVLKQIRQQEQNRGISPADGVRIIMTTASDSPEHIIDAFNTGCEAYIIKPVSEEKLIEEMKKVGLMNDQLVP